MGNYLIGMDLGTTNIKGIIIAENGTLIASASKANDLILSGSNMAEQDAGQWWQNAVDIFRSITKDAGADVVNQIRGICVSSQTTTMLPVDKEGQVLRNPIIWMDGRAAEELGEITSAIGMDKYISVIGAQPDATFMPSKILWFKKHEPQLFSKTHRILQASSYINFKLTGQMTMDIDQAAKGQCLDLSTLSWSDAVSDSLGIDLNTLLPQPVPATTIIGTVTDAAARETGLAAGIPVVAGASDALASMYATGVCRPGEAGESSGTSSLLFVGHDRPSPTDLPVVAKPCPIPGMPYSFDAPVNATGASIKWYLDTMGKQDYEDANALNLGVYDYLNQQAGKSVPGSHSLFFFPYMTGVRAPLWNSHAKGMMIGLSLDTHREDIIRAIFEGTAFSLRHVLETVKENDVCLDSLRITGGGAKSRVWSQIKASVLRIPVYILEDSCGDVPFGDALIAGNAVGVFPDLQKTMQSLVHVKEIIQPIEAWADLYDKLYPFYIRMYKDLDEDLKKLQDL